MALPDGPLTAKDLYLLTDPVDTDYALSQVALVVSMQKPNVDARGMADLASAIASVDEGWTKPELAAAARLLSKSSDLRDAIRYGRTLVYADFEEARTADAPSSGRLLSYFEAMSRWQRAGEPGTFPDAMFEKVAKDKNGKILLRLI